MCPCHGWAGGGKFSRCPCCAEVSLPISLAPCCGAVATAWARPALRTAFCSHCSLSEDEGPWAEGVWLCEPVESLLHVKETSAGEPASIFMKLCFHKLLVVQ